MAPGLAMAAGLYAHTADGKKVTCRSAQYYGVNDAKVC